MNTLKQLLQKLQDELNLRNEEFHAAEDITKKLVNERLSLEQRMSELEKKKADEVVLLILEFGFRNLNHFYKVRNFIHSNYWNADRFSRKKI